MSKDDDPTGFTRREALRLLLAGGASLAAGRAAAVPDNRQLMRAIPKTGESIPAVGLGTSRTFEVGSSEAARTGPREVLQAFAEAGGRVVDTSPMYGEAETVVGDLAQQLHLAGKLFLATKVWTRGRDDGIRQMEASFQRLRTTRMDLMQIHNLLDWQTHLKTLRAWKEQGRVRYIGITHYTESAYDDLAKVLKREDLDFVQLNYSIAEREAEQRLLPLAQERRVAVLINRPFARSGLFDKVRNRELPAWAKEFDCATWAQFFLKFILSHPAVTCVIPATSKPKHLLDNMQAGLGKLPDGATRKKMAEYVRQL
ncbi:MAG: aldo/keto reductase [Gammaproteobacteria bacterium]|nr:aldo/keto reductase [Gammaproteobacteria bacterium]